MRERTAGKKGFTLIELLVVIAIIALLVSILIPSLAMAKELARRAICSGQFRHIALAANMYAAQNDQNLPSAAFYSHVLMISKDAADHGDGSGYWPGSVTDPSRVRYMNAGLLIQEGLIEQPIIFECPSIPTLSTWEGAGFLTRPWGGNNAGVTRLSFLEAGRDEVDGVQMGPYGIAMVTVYTPNVFHTTWWCWNPVYEEVRVMLEGSGWRSYNSERRWDTATRALVSDWCYHDHSTHRGWPHGYDGYNVGSVDGSVRWKPDYELADRILSYYTLNDLWDDDGYMDKD